MKICLAPDFRSDPSESQFPPDLLEIFREARDELGCRNICFLAQYGDSADEVYFVASTLPEAFLRTYFAKGLAAVDPVLANGRLVEQEMLHGPYEPLKSKALAPYYESSKAHKIGAWEFSVPQAHSQLQRSVTTFLFGEDGSYPRASVEEKRQTCRRYAERINNYIAQAGEMIDESVPGHLTTREIEVLRAVADGASYPKIADTLGISRWTVIAHTRNIRSKLDVKTNAEAVAVAVQRSLI